MLGCAANNGAKRTPPWGNERRPPACLWERSFSHFHHSELSVPKMLYLVGLGLSDETDITVKGLDVVKKASRVYLEAYTSILLVDQSVLVGRPRLARGPAELTLTASRRTTMDDRSQLRTVRWSSLIATRYYGMHRRKM